MEPVQAFNIIYEKVKLPENYVPRQHETIGGMWTVDRWRLGDIEVELQDEEWTRVVRVPGASAVMCGHQTVPSVTGETEALLRAAAALAVGVILSRPGIRPGWTVDAAGGQSWTHAGWTLTAHEGSTEIGWTGPDIDIDVEVLDPTNCSIAAVREPVLRVFGETRDAGELCAMPVYIPIAVLTEFVHAYETLKGAAQ